MKREYPQIGMKYLHVNGGFLYVHVRMNDDVYAIIRDKNGKDSAPQKMTAAEFYAMVDEG